MKYGRIETKWHTTCLPREFIDTELFAIMLQMEAGYKAREKQCK